MLILRQPDVICWTFIVARDAKLFGIKLIDEAAQAYEPEWIIMGLRKKNRNTSLYGINHNLA